MITLMIRYVLFEDSELSRHKLDVLVILQAENEATTDDIDNADDDDDDDVPLDNVNDDDDDDNAPFEEVNIQSHPWY